MGSGLETLRVENTDTRHHLLTRQRKSLSMTVLAGRAGLSQQSISYIERGLRIPNLDTLIRLTDALEIELWPLLKKATEKTRPKGN